MSDIPGSYRPKSAGTVQDAAQRLADAGLHPAQRHLVSTESRETLERAAPELLEVLENTTCIGCETRIGAPAKDMTQALSMPQCPVCKPQRDAIAKARGAL